MGMSVKKKEYRVLIKTATQTIDKTQPMTLGKAIDFMCNVVYQLSNSKELMSGKFIETTNPFTKEEVIKRYVIELKAPYTQIEIFKLSKGSINKNVFNEILAIVKEKYERI